MKNHPSILLVDNDDVSIFITKRLLEKTKLFQQIEIRRSGEEASEFLAHYWHIYGKMPDIIALDLLDVESPPLPICHLFEKSHLFPNCPFLILSVCDYAYRPLLCGRHPIQYYLPKPLSSQTLDPLLRSILLSVPTSRGGNTSGL